MSLTTACAADIVAALLLGVDPTWRSTAIQASWYLRLHTASPTTAGGFANEATYTGYAAVAVPRSAAGWTDAGDGLADNAGLVQFPTCTGATDSQVITHVSLCTDAVRGTMVAFTALAVPRTITVNIWPEIQIGALDLVVT